MVSKDLNQGLFFLVHLVVHKLMVIRTLIQQDLNLGLVLQMKM